MRENCTHDDCMHVVACVVIECINIYYVFLALMEMGVKTTVDKRVFPFFSIEVLWI